MVHPLPEYSQQVKRVKLSIKGRHEARKHTYLMPLLVSSTCATHRGTLYRDKAFLVFPGNAMFSSLSDIGMSLHYHVAPGMCFHKHVVLPAKHI